jgi:probable phosphoglycerate mutase
VVCHRKPIMVVLAHLLDIPHTRAWRLAAAPGSLTAIEVWSDGTASIAFTNRT